MSDDTREKFINYVALQLKECLEHLDSCYSWAVPLPRLNVKGFVESKEQRFGRFVESLASSVHGLNHVNDVIAMRRIFSIYAREIGLVCEELKASTDISNDQQMFLSYVVEGWGKVNVNKSNSDKNGYINLLNKIELNDGCGDRILN